MFVLVYQRPLSASRYGTVKPRVQYIDSGLRSSTRRHAALLFHPYEVASIPSAQHATPWYVEQARPSCLFRPGGHEEQF